MSLCIENSGLEKCETFNPRSKYIVAGQNSLLRVKIHCCRSKYMGIWGRLRFARKPICVIGEGQKQ